MTIKTNITTAAMALSLIAGVALATAATTPAETPPVTNGQGYGMMNGQGFGNGMGMGQRNGQGNGQGIANGQGSGNGHHMFNGQGRHHKGNAYGKGMRGHNGQNCFQNNRGRGMGQQQGMMQGQRGMNGGGAMMNPELVEKRNQFLDSTAELRKQLHDNHFSYREALRNPAMTQGELDAKQKEIYTMRQELQTKRLAAFNAK
ncbi:MAG: hypothetical protein KAR01_08940 [Desulfocapsa sp.]|nr:hypothetical protein [Desulfocapsa sp.]